MNLFEAGVMPSIPVGAVIGGVLCKSYGTAAGIGGILAGGVVGGFAGWGYALLVMFLMVILTILWRAARDLPQQDPREEEMANMSRVGRLGIIVGILVAGVMGLVAGWLHGVIVLLAAAVVTALTAVSGEQLRRK